MINTQKNRQNLYMDLDKLAITRRLKVLLNTGRYILRPEDGKYVPKVVTAAWDTPWVYVQSLPNARCDLYHKIFFNILDHIHSYCRSCWKVVVRPKNLIQLFDLYEFQRRMGVACKCGWERRQTVEGSWGGYFYTRSKEQGLERYKEVRELVNEKLSPDVPVILKRYCTEFELGDGTRHGKGPSDLTPDVTQEEKEMEEYIESRFPNVGYSSCQSDDSVATVMMSWIDHAFAIKEKDDNGELTYKQFTNSERLVKEYITYHNRKE